MVLIGMQGTPARDKVELLATCQEHRANYYSRTPHKAYPLVDGSRYALWEVMRYERSILV